MSGHTYTDAHDWALFVPEDDPHGLRDLQHQLKISVPAVLERAQRSPVKRLLHALDLVLSLFAVIGPVLAVTVFFDMSGAVTRRYDFDAGFELAVAGLGFVCGAYFEVKSLHRWRTRGRHRESASILLSGLVLACALGTIVQAYAMAGRTPMLVTLVLIPAFVTALGAVTVIALHAKSPPAPANTIPAPRPPEREFDLTSLDGDSRTAVLTCRNKALRALSARGLLPGHDLDELQARPLGQLLNDGAGDEGPLDDSR